MASDKPMKLKARAVFTVTLEIDASCDWGANCAFDQLHKQASEDVLNRLDKLFKPTKNAHLKPIDLKGFRYIGRPVVRAVIAGEDNGK